MHVLGLASETLHVATLSWLQQQCSGSFKQIQTTNQNTVAQRQVSVRLHGKSQIPYEARIFRALHAKNYEFWFRFVEDTMADAVHYCIVSRLVACCLSCLLTETNCRRSPLLYGPVFSYPAFSSPVIWSCIFRSCISRSSIVNAP